MEIKNCCFTGHRRIKNTDILRSKLIEAICVFINEYGTTDFFAEGCICYYNEKRPFSGTGQTVRMAM